MPDIGNGAACKKRGSDPPFLFSFSCVYGMIQHGGGCMRWLFLILVFVVGLCACGILFDFLFCDSSGWKEWREERVLQKVSENSHKKSNNS